MIRLIVVCAAAALLLAACASDTIDPNASGAGRKAGPAAWQAPAWAGVSRLEARRTRRKPPATGFFFDTDRSVVTSDGKTTLDRQVQWLQQNPQIGVWVAGNCDERGTEEYNLALGQRRANADRRLTWHSRGIETRRIQTISYGKSRPLDPASTQDAWAHNPTAITSERRVRSARGGNVNDIS